MHTKYPMNIINLKYYQGNRITATYEGPLY